MTEVSTRPFSLALSTPLATAAGDIERREGVLVRLRTRTDTGEDPVGVGVGVGEATPLPGWTERQADCRDALRAAGERLEGRVLSGADAVVADLAETPAAQHGLALALADLRSRRREQSLATHLLGGRGNPTPGRVRANATIGDGTPEETADRAAVAVERGFDCLKVKVGVQEPGTDLDRLAAVERTVGDDVTLRADANAAWDRVTARRVFDAVAERDIEVAYVEQPLAPADLSGHAALREREDERPDGGTAVALDESLALRGPGPETALSAGAADVLVLKPMALGGPRRALDVVRSAREAGVRSVVTTTVDAAVARAAAVQTAAVVDSLSTVGEESIEVRTAHGLATGSMLAEDLCPDPAPVEGGRVDVSSGPGTGVDPEVFDR